MISAGVAPGSHEQPLRDTDGVHGAARRPERHPRAARSRRPGLRLAVPDEELVRTPSLLMNGFAALPVLLGVPA